MTHKIQWLNLPGYKGESWNPIIGCSKISEGCKNCYAERQAFRVANMSVKYASVLKQEPDENGIYFVKPKWNGKTELHTPSINKPSQWKTPRIIFVCSMGDLFHENTPFQWIEKVFNIMASNPQHIFIVITKRAKRMFIFFWKTKLSNFNKTHQNVWMGVTAETEKDVKERVPFLVHTPAKIKLVSVEPMLEKIDLNDKGFCLFQIDWLICGGESGPKARPMHPDWPRSLRDQCKKEGIPFFFKQWGEWLPWENDAQPPFINSQNGQCIDAHGINIYDTETGETSKNWDDGLWGVSENLSPCCFQKVGKKAAGNLLDGEKHEQYPLNILYKGEN